MQSVVTGLEDLFLLIPMPWRFALVIGVSAILVYQLVKRVLPLILWLEYGVTDRLRRWGRGPLPGAYALGEAVEITTKLLHRASWIVLGLAAVVVAGWYARPAVGNATVANYIDRSIEAWYELEARAIPQATAKQPMPEETSDSPAFAPSVEPTPLVTDEGSTRTEETPEEEPDAPRPTEEPVDYFIHTVSRGDTLFDIAVQYDVPMETLIELNADEYPSLREDYRLLSVGWDLKIPRNR